MHRSLSLQRSNRVELCDRRCAQTVQRVEDGVFDLISLRVLDSHPQKGQESRRGGPGVLQGVFFAKGGKLVEIDLQVVRHL